MPPWATRRGARPASNVRNTARCHDTASARTALARFAERVGINHSAADGCSLCPRPVAGAPVALQQDGTVPNTAKMDEARSSCHAGNIFARLRPANTEPWLQVPSHVLPLLQGIVATSAAQHGDSLVGVYLRGSLPQGHYIDGMSDVDTFCIVLSDPRTAAPHSSSPGQPEVRDMLLAQGHQPDLVATVRCPARPACHAFCPRNQLVCGRHLPRGYNGQWPVASWSSGCGGAAVQWHSGTVIDYRRTAVMPHVMKRQWWSAWCRWKQWCMRWCGTPAWAMPWRT
jgi:hypothetical protein